MENIMKKHILALIIAAVMAMCPVLAYADSEASTQGEGVQTETAQAEDSGAQTDGASDQTEAGQPGDGTEGTETDPAEGGEDPIDEPVIQPGWNEDRTIYYLEDGTAATGLFWAEAADGTEALYYANEEGLVKTTSGWVYQDGNKYRVTTNGTVRTQEGVFMVGDYRYVIPNGAVNGAVCRTVGPIKVDGTLYYVRNKNGRLGAYNKAYTLNKKVYHIGSKGVVITGKHKWKDKKYYYSVKSGYLKPSAGMIVVGNSRFHVKKGGLVTVNAKFKSSGNYYIASSNGNVYKGLFKWKKTLYYASSKGILKAKSGIVTVKDYDYFVAAGGKVYVNRMITSNGKKYCADSNGRLRKGVFKFNGKYYFAETDHTIRTAAKVFKYGGKYYYNKKGGGLARNRFVEYKEQHYYAGDTAALLTTTFNMKGVTFHPASNGVLPEEEYRKLYPLDDDEDDY